MARHDQNKAHAASDSLRIVFMRSAPMQFILAAIPLAVRVRKDKAVGKPTGSAWVRAGVWTDASRQPVGGCLVVPRGGFVRAWGPGVMAFRQLHHLPAPPTRGWTHGGSDGLVGFAMPQIVAARGSPELGPGGREWAFEKNSKSTRRPICVDFDFNDFSGLRGSVERDRTARQMGLTA